MVGGPGTTRSNSKHKSRRPIPRQTTAAGSDGGSIHRQLATVIGRVPPAEDGTVNVSSFQRHGVVVVEPVTSAARGVAKGAGGGGGSMGMHGHGHMGHHHHFRQNPFLFGGWGWGGWGPYGEGNTTVVAFPQARHSGRAYA
jgi:hypothetical protein